MNQADKVDPEHYYFGDFCFDASTGDLSDGLKTTRLSPQIAKLLDFFLNHQNVLISRSELIVAVWEDRIVSDDAINRTISNLRQILSNKDKEFYIETVVRRGYISHFPPAMVEKPTGKKPSQSRKYVIIVMLVFLLAFLLYAFIRSPISSLETTATKPHQLPIVAVLPFTVTSIEDDSQIFADGIQDDLITQLAQLRSIRVISRTSVLGFKNSNRNLRTIGLELGADYILEGGIQSVSNHIRVNVQLINAKLDEHLWAEQYDRELTAINIFAIQTEITRAISASLHTTFVKKEDLDVNILPTDNMAAYKAYHQGMLSRTIKGLSKSHLQAMKEAVRLDPNFVQAWVEIAASLSLHAFNKNSPELISEIDKVLVKIHTLAPNSVSYLTAQTYYTYYILKDYDLAYQLVRRAQHLSPSNVQILELKSWIQRRLGNTQGKLESLRMAQKLDPRNISWLERIIRDLIINHKYKEAEQELSQVKKLSFNLAIYKSMLHMQENRNFKQWLNEALDIQKEFRRELIPLNLWDFYVADRNYIKAENIVDAEEIYFSNTKIELYKILSYWFLNKNIELKSMLIKVNQQIVDNHEGGDNANDINSYLIRAFIAAIEGKSKETQQLIKIWDRASYEDLANRGGNLHYTCRALGIAQATAATVKCIKEALKEANFVIPFIEPYLPYYDSIRETSQFIKMLAELKN